jgi:Tol biopolymer transport system component
MFLPSLPTTRARLAVPVLTAGLALMALAPGAHASFPGDNGKIAVGFSFGCDGSMIATMQPDGSAFGLLTESACNNEQAPYLQSPEWSADGERLLVKNLAEAPVTMTASGTLQAPVPLASTPSFAAGKASFSPDGREFVYTRNVIAANGARSEIWRASVDGTRDVRLRSGTAPRWSPNGRTIAYVAPLTTQQGKPAAKTGTWLMSARTGKRIRRVGPTASTLDWSPDGTRILYSPAACCADVKTDLFVARADGGGTRRIARTSRRGEYGAVWSPDGRRIAFLTRTSPSEETVQYRIYTMNRRGGDLTRIYRSEVVSLEEVLGGGPVISWQPLAD